MCKQQEVDETSIRYVPSKEYRQEVQKRDLSPRWGSHGKFVEKDPELGFEERQDLAWWKAWASDWPGERCVGVGRVHRVIGEGVAPEGYSNREGGATLSEFWKPLRVSDQKTNLFLWIPWSVISFGLRSMLDPDGQSLPWWLWHPAQGFPSLTEFLTGQNSDKRSSPPHFFPLPSGEIVQVYEEWLEAHWDNIVL